MSFKITHLFALAFAMLLVVMSTGAQNQAEATQFPRCPRYTELLCKPPLNFGNWDGGSCGLDTQHKYDRFVKACVTAKDSKHQLNCWN
ncbi:hypothetical protein BGX33_009219 [Mortierella sp. NVP41]|nr:hypothetical protein BGX33_009219 [Mortierella sp. NVP41]